MNKLTGLLLLPFPFLLFPALSEAQIAINNTAANPDASAILDLNSGNSGVNKGFLAPQVALTNVATAAPVTSPATGLMVYSTSAPTGGNGTGYYYWTGAVWASLNSTISGSGTNNYVARWTPNGTTLGMGLIQDNGSEVGINNAPVAGDMLYVKSTGHIGIYASGDSAITAYGSWDGVKAFGSFYGVEGHGTTGGVLGGGVTYGGNFSAAAGWGVFGQGTTMGGNFFASAGQGVYGVSHNAAGDSSVGYTYGTYGISSYKNGFGLYGTNSATGGVGISATGDTAITAYGTKYGINAYAQDIAVLAESHNIGILATGTDYGISAGGGNYGGSFTSGTGVGVYGAAPNEGGYFIGTKKQGVYTLASNAAGDSIIAGTYGVYAVTSDAAGTHAAIYGSDNNSTIGGTGVYGSGYNYGVYGNGHIEGVYGSGGNFGIYGVGPDGGVFGQGEQYGGGLGIEGVGYAAGTPNYPNYTGNAFSGTRIGLYASETTDSNTDVAAIYAEDAKTSDYAELNAWSGGTHYKVLANYSGTVSCSVRDLNGDKVVMHCPETPEFYFEDYGDGQLTNGKAHIDLDPVLAKNVAINEKHHLRVFVQLEGNCKGVYVTNKTATGFDVVELDGGTSNTPFEWHIVCNVKDETEGGAVNHNQDLRFEKAPVTEMNHTHAKPVLNQHTQTGTIQTPASNQ
jgi:trimeric autotransporter adhesin